MWRHRDGTGRDVTSCLRHVLPSAFPEAPGRSRRLPEALGGRPFRASSRDRGLWRINLPAAVCPSARWIASLGATARLLGRAPRSRCRCRCRCHCRCPLSLSLPAVTVAARCHCPLSLSLLGRAAIARCHRPCRCRPLPLPAVTARCRQRLLRSEILLASRPLSQPSPARRRRWGMTWPGRKSARQTGFSAGSAPISAKTGDRRVWRPVDVAASGCRSAVCMLSSGLW